MAVVIPNTKRIQANADTTVADALQQVTKYINNNVTQKPGTRRAVPSAASHPISPTPK